MLLDPQETSSLNQLIIQQIGCHNRSRMANLNGNKLVLCSTINRGETIKYDWINNYINNNNNNAWSSSSTSTLNKHSNITNDFDLSSKHNHLNHLNHNHHQHNAPVYHIFYSTEYSDSIIYIMAVLFIYFLLFSLLIYANWTSFNHNNNNNNSNNSSNKSNYKNYENECVKKKKRPKHRNNNNNNRLDYNIVANGYNDIVAVVDDDDNDDNNVNCNQQTHQYDDEALDSKVNFMNGFGNNRQTLIIQMMNDGDDDNDQSRQIQITTQRLCLTRNIRKFFNHTFKTWLQLLTRNFRNRHLLINDNSLIVYHKKLPNNELEFI